VPNNQSPSGSAILAPLVLQLRLQKPPDPFEEHAFSVVGVGRPFLLYMARLNMGRVTLKCPSPGPRLRVITLAQPPRTKVPPRHPHGDRTASSHNAINKRRLGKTRPLEVLPQATVETYRPSVQHQVGRSLGTKAHPMLAFSSLLHRPMHCAEGWHLHC